MKEITINGVSYLPASALAKQFRYTTDYIGQLCRAKKVDAQLIGRSWYVNPLSLTAHKSGRYAKAVVPKQQPQEEALEPEEKLEVEPVIAKKTVRIVKSAPTNFAKRIEWKPLKYEPDEGDLLPHVKREISPVKVAINLAESSDITIKTASKMTTLVADELPTVSLRGKVKVASLEETFDEATEEKTDDIPVPETEPEAPLAEKKTKKEFVHNVLPTKDVILKKKIQKHAMPQGVVSPFTPQAVIAIEGEEEEVGIIHITLATTSGVLVLLLVLIFFTESTITADALSYQWGMNFSTQSLAALTSLFAR